MGKIDIKTFWLCFFIFLLSMSYTSVFASPTILGTRVGVCAGNDPDIAVDAEGNLHLTYVRGGQTYYRKVMIPYTDKNNIGKEYYIGGGANPQIAVDSLNNPHIVFGRAHYAYWTGDGFKEAEQALSGWRKNLIAVDSKDRVYVVADKFHPRSAMVRVYKDGKPATILVNGKPTPHKAKEVGDDNPGGIGFDTDDIMYFNWRGSSYTYARTYQFYNEETQKYDDTQNKYKFPNKSGDFSWICVNPIDNNARSIYTAAHSSGLYYSVRKDGKWQNLSRIASGYGDKTEPDHVNPVMASDALGNTYVTFRGHYARGYYLVYDKDDNMLPIVGDRDGIAQFATGTNPGAKMTNPNVATHPKMTGAYVAWGTSTVYINSIGDIELISENSALSSGIYNILIGEDHLPPVIIAAPVTDLTETSATLNATVDPNNFNTTVTLVYSESDDLSNPISVIVNNGEAFTGADPVMASAGLSSLTNGTTYYYRFTAESSKGISEDDIKSFETATIK